MTPQNANNLKIGIAVVAVLSIGYFLLSGNTTGGGSDDPTGNTGGSAGGQTAFNVKTATSKLYELMRYSGSDEKKIVAFFRYITPAQFAQIYTEFGQRQYNKTFGNQQNPTAWFDELPFEPLEVWLDEELSDEEYNNLALKYPNYL